MLFYVYTRDRAALRQQLLTDGVEVGEIQCPAHISAGQIRVCEADGYCLVIGQRAGTA